MATIFIKTWSCPVCGYNQDFNPVKNLQYFNVPSGLCRACWQDDKKHDRITMVIQTDKNKRIEHNRTTNTEIDSRNITAAAKTKLKTQLAADLVKSRAIEDNS